MASPPASRRMLALADPGPKALPYHVEGIEAIRSELAAGHAVWIDVEAPTLWDVEQIRTAFPFHPLALEDVLHAVQRPKIEEYEGHLFLTVFGFRREGRIGFTPLEVNAFIGKNFLVTFHEEPVPVIGETAQKCETGRLLLDRGTDFLLHAILDGLIDSGISLVDAFDEASEELEEWRPRRSPESLERIFETRKGVLRLRRILHPHVEVLGQLATREHPYISRTVRTYFRDVHDHALRILDATDSVREIIDTAVDTYLSQATESTNRVMKTLTVIATLGVPLTVLTGFFGMNFEHMGILHHPWGVWIFMAITIVIEVTLLAVFRVKGWL